MKDTITVTSTSFKVCCRKRWETKTGKRSLSLTGTVVAPCWLAAGSREASSASHVPDWFRGSMLVPSSLHLADFTVTVATAQGGVPRCGQTGLNCPRPSWKQLCSQVKAGRGDRGRGLKEGQADPANQESKRQETSRRGRELKTNITPHNARLRPLHNSAVHHLYSPPRLTASAGHRRHGDACLETSSSKGARVLLVRTSTSD